MKSPFNVTFEDVYECTHPKIDRIMNVLGESESFDLIYHNDQCDIFRAFTQSKFRVPYTFNVAYIASKADEETFLVCSGVIRCSDPIEVQEYEKIGKRKLYNALKNYWSIQF